MQRCLSPHTCSLFQITSLPRDTITYMPVNETARCCPKAWFPLSFRTPVKSVPHGLRHALSCFAASTTTARACFRLKQRFEKLNSRDHAVQAYKSRLGGGNEVGMEDLLMAIQSREAFNFVQTPPQNVRLLPPLPHASCSNELAFGQQMIVVWGLMIWKLTHTSSLTFRAVIPCPVASLIPDIFNN